MKRVVVVFLLAALVPILVFELFVRQANNGQQAPQKHIENHAKGHDQIVAELINNESLIRGLDRNLSILKHAVLNLSLPGESAKKLFAKKFRLKDIDSLVKSKDASYLVRCSEPKTVDNESGFAIWEKFLIDVSYFDQAKFYSVRVVESDDQHRIIKTGFSALAKLRSGKWLSIEATGKIRWGYEGQNWKIFDWDFEKFELFERSNLMFGDTTANLFSPLDLANVQYSKHYETVLKVLNRGEAGFPNEMMRKFFPRGGATGRHPSVAVVDIDRDGWDDLYLVEQWRENLLFRNNGDGTFKEESSRYDLNLSDYDSCGLFADFDNDGDVDLILGRSLSKCIYLENENGRFTDRTESKFKFDTPCLSTALSAADFNNDGLLDLYISTYGFTGVKTKLWTEAFLNEADRAEVIKRINAPEYNRFLNATGPQNLLLVNRGSHFEISEFNDQVAVWANTFQGTWSDFDNDGDQDLYVANDFCRDYLFRNDGDSGFTDVTMEIGDETMAGFGMGATWGDYDLDGNQDLYVSNMYSKAGIRITEHFDQLAPGFRRSADGNRLYHNTGSRLDLVSSNESKGIDVHKAGWSWGGQFFDVQNDGYLDLYVTAGYFTAPQIFASDKDL